MFILGNSQAKFNEQSMEELNKEWDEKKSFLCPWAINHKSCKDHKSWLFVPFKLSSLAAVEGDLKAASQLLRDTAVLICLFLKLKQAGVGKGFHQHRIVSWTGGMCSQPSKEGKGPLASHLLSAWLSQDTHC